MNKKTLAVFGLLLCLMLAVTVFLITESLNRREETFAIENNFQQEVHGVGLGATIKPTWCYINFDPRIDPCCSCIEWPIPGGYCYCPDHTGTVSYIEGNKEIGVAIEIVKKYSAKEQ